MSDKKYVVVPFYNEHNRINTKYLNNLISNKNISYIFVDDGSIDQTLEDLNLFNDVTVLTYKKNRGKAEAVRFGVNWIFENDKNENILISYLDSDGAFDIKDVNNQLENFDTITNNNGVDAIFSSRVKLAGRNIVRNEFRHLISRVLITIFGFFNKKIPYDTQSGFKVFKINKNSRIIFQEGFKTRWFFDIEILLRFKVKLNRTMLIWEEPLGAWADVKGSRIKGLEFVRIFKEIFIIIKLLREGS
jgi:hypothetical protein